MYAKEYFVLVKIFIMYNNVHVFAKHQKQNILARFWNNLRKKNMFTIITGGLNIYLFVYVFVVQPNIKQQIEA